METGVGVCGDPRLNTILQFYCDTIFAVASESELWDIIDNYNLRSINRVMPVATATTAESYPR